MAAGGAKMQFKNLLLATTALVGSVTLVSATAEADSINFANSYGASTAPDSIDGAFDISGFLNSELVAGNAVTITAGTVQIYGYSPPANTYTSTYTGDYVAGYATGYYAATGYYSYSCGWSTCYGSYTYYVPYTYAVYGSSYNVQQGDLQVDKALADFGDQQLSADDSKPNTYSYTTTSYTHTYTTTGNDSGTVSGSTPLDLASLNNLTTTSVLDYVLSTTQGQFNGLNLELDLTFTTSPLSSDLAATPLPGAIPLFASGLFALGLLGRRKKRKLIIDT